MTITKAKLLLSIFILFTAIQSVAISIDVRIFSTNTITQFSFTPISGKYILHADNLPISTDLYKNNTLEFKLKGNKIEISKNNIVLGTCSEATLKTGGLVNAFNVNTGAAKKGERIYDDELQIKIVDNRIQLINRVDLEHYIAGVVQSEVLGSSKDIEFFKIQAIIARTYTLTNIMKHLNDGYNLCDETHCQAYYRRCNDATITQAVSETFCDVIVNDDGKLISAAFHSNSGGQTENSENVWSIPTSYLKSVQDTFSLKGRNASWEKKMPKKQWLDFFIEKYPSLSNNIEKQHQLCNFSSSNRVKYILDSIPMRSLRSAFNLRSTFFSVSENKDIITITGKGYGHGVGLSQEGAINMVKLGYKAEAVIKYYYKNVRIVKYTDILKF